MSKIAVYDWGIGGLGFYREWKALFPEHGIVYFSDSGFKPYGQLGETELKNRVEQVVKYLEEEYNVTHVMVACNAASSILKIAKFERSQVEGVVERTVNWMKSMQFSKSLAIVGGIRTVESSVYSKSFRPYVLKEIIGQEMSAVVESGNIGNKYSRAAIENVFRGVNEELDLVLACTHYVVLSEEISAQFPNLSCHDPIPEVVLQLKQVWKDKIFFQGTDIFLTTGNSGTMKHSAALCFDVIIPTIISCKLERLV